MTGFNPRAFFIHPKKTLFAFIIFYLFLMSILAIITGRATIKSCSSCAPDLIATVLYYMITVGLTYFLFCWMNYMWKKAWNTAK